MSLAWRLAGACAWVLLVAACAITPPATPQQDTLAKEFVIHPDASAIYVYRSPYNHFDVNTVLYLDGRLIGMTQPGAYFRLDTTPGLHTIHGTGIDAGELTLKTRPGQIYFVALDVHGGHSRYTVVPAAAGRQRVLACCALLDSLAPQAQPFVLR